MYLINHVLNKFTPLIIIAGLSFYSFGWLTFEPYVIVMATLYANHYSFHSGYAFAWCKCKGLIEDNEEDVQ